MQQCPIAEVVFPNEWDCLTINRELRVRCGDICGLVRAGGGAPGLRRGSKSNDRKAQRPASDGGGLDHVHFLGPAFIIGIISCCHGCEGRGVEIMENLALAIK
jgi:hypothetical protein